jgi:hypothetical protein
MEVAKDVILDLTSQFIEWLIITWLAAQAAAILTCGASEAAAAAATTGSRRYVTGRDDPGERSWRSSESSKRLLPAIMPHVNLSKDVELLVLRHENQVLRRQAGGRSRWDHTDPALANGVVATGEPLPVGGDLPGHPGHDLALAPKARGVQADLHRPASDKDDHPLVPRSRR